MTHRLLCVWAGHLDGVRAIAAVIEALFLLMCDSSKAKIWHGEHVEWDSTCLESLRTLLFIQFDCSRTVDSTAGEVEVSVSNSNDIL